MQRPNSVLILGILSLIFGGLGVLATFSSAAILFSADSRNPVVVIMQANAAYRIWLWVSSVLGLVGAGALIAAGIGLLKSRPWGRSLAIIYSIYALVMCVVGMVINVLYLVMPLVEQASHASGPEVYGALGGAIGGSLGGLFGMLFPIIMLVFMTRDNVVRFFQGQSQPLDSSLQSAF